MKLPVEAGMPRVIKIGPLRYTVTPRKNLTIKAEDMAYMDTFRHEGDVVNLRGAHSSDDLHIEMDVNQPPSLFRQTLVHELLHALVSSAPLDGMFDDAKTEEKFVSRFAPWLTAVIQENPRLVEFLTDRRQGGAGSATWWRNQ